MLRLRRKSFMLTQEQVCKILEIDKSYLSLIENKKRCCLNASLIKKICDLYKISPNDLSDFLNDKSQ